MNIIDVNKVQKIIKEINWVKVFLMIEHLGSDLNEMMYRSDKGALIELAIDKFSNSKLQRCNLRGCDHIIPELNNIRIEIKYQKGSLFTPTGNLKPKTKTIPLKNPMGSYTSRALHQTFDFILLIDDYGVAIAPFDVVLEFKKETRDQLIAQIPTDKLTILYVPSDFKEVMKLPITTRFIDLKKQSMINYLTQFEEPAKK